MKRRASHRWRLLCLMVTAVIGLNGPARGDVIVTTDGRRLEGTLQKDGDEWVVTAADGSTNRVKAGQVKSMELGRKGTNSETGVVEALASLRRSSEVATDAAKIVERYRAFIDSHRGSAVESDATMDLAVWQDRVTRGMIKIGPHWIEREEALRLRAGATDTARSAILALRESRLGEAGDAITQALQADPTNATAHYLRGILLYRQDKFADAKKAFDAALAAAPAHGPTLGNIAVTASNMKQWGVALNAYNAALVSMPMERGLLNNIAELLQLLPAQQRNLGVTKQVERKFLEQDALLAQRLAPQGLYRWGATWVNQKQMDDIRAAEKAQKDQLDQLATAYDKTVAKVNLVDGQIKAINEDLRQIEASSFTYGPNGEIVRLALPQSYYNRKAEGEKLSLERQQAVLEQGTLRERARNARTTFPYPKYTGVQQLYAAEAAPVAVSLPAEVTPASRPAAPSPPIVP